MSAQGRQSGFGTGEKAQGYTEGNIKANKEKTRLVIDGAKKCAIIIYRQVYD